MEFSEHRGVVNGILVEGIVYSQYYLPTGSRQVPGTRLPDHPQYYRRYQYANSNRLLLTLCSTDGERRM